MSSYPTRKEMEVGEILYDLFIAYNYGHLQTKLFHLEDAKTRARVPLR